MVSFRIDGTDYEIDLCAENAAGLRETLAPYIAAGRKAGRRSNQAARTKQSAKTPLPAPSSIRKRAEVNGHTSSTRGTIPADILEAD